MLAEILNFTQSELNLASGVVKTLIDPDLTINTFSNKHYRPFSIKVSNDSGATINFALFTDFEYNAYVDDPTISHLIPVKNTEEDSVNNFRGEVTTIMCSGTVGHTSGVNFVIIKE